MNNNLVIWNFSFFPWSTVYQSNVTLRSPDCLIRCFDCENVTSWNSNKSLWCFILNVYIFQFFKSFSSTATISICNQRPRVPCWRVWSQFYIKRLTSNDRDMLLRFYGPSSSKVKSYSLRCMNHAGKSSWKINLWSY